MSDLAFLEEDDTQAAPAMEQPEPPPAAEADTPPVAETPPAEPEPQPEPAPPQQVPPGHVPLAAMLEWRDKARQAEQEAAQYRAQQQPQEEAPVLYEDATPAEIAQYLAHQQEQQRLQIEQTTRELVIDFSRRTAEMQHGPEITTQAREWGVRRMSEDPTFAAKITSSRDPYGETIAEMRREQQLAVASTMTPEEIEQFQAWKAAQAGSTAPLSYAPGQPGSPPLSAPKLPPRSLAGAPSAGGVVRQVEPEPFDAEFKS